MLLTLRSLWEPQPQIFTATAVASAEAFGSSAAVLVETASAIASTEAFGTAKELLVETAAGIGSAQAFGSPAGVQIGTAVGIGSNQGFGGPAIVLIEGASGIASSEAFGSGRDLLVEVESGIPSDEAFGLPTLVQAPAPVTSQAGGGGSRWVISGGLGPVPYRAVAQSVATTSIDSDEGFGKPGLVMIARPRAIAGKKIFGPAAVAIAPVASLDSDEAFGAARVRQQPPRFFVIEGGAADRANDVLALSAEEETLLLALLAAA